MGYLIPRLEMFSTTTQNIATNNVAQIVTFNNTIQANKITVTSSSRFTIVEAGRYLVTCNPQINLSGGTNQTFNMWVRLNGSDVANSNSKWGIVSTSADSTTDFYQSILCVVGDFIEIWISGTNTSLQLINVAPGGGAPATPSASLIIVKTNNV
jgi:hypothetical protein